MLDYRLYFMNNAGHIVDAAEALHDSDHKAVEWAEQFRDGRELELWNGGRIVAKLGKKQEPAGPPAHGGVSV